MTNFEDFLIKYKSIAWFDKNLLKTFIPGSFQLFKLILDERFQADAMELSYRYSNYNQKEISAIFKWFADRQLFSCIFCMAI